ncbi:DUF4376 domain-containing protein [Methylobacterium organophilum]|nr:DUF4376 domain-containing protein [Methylobacterium organophilum]
MTSYLRVQDGLAVEMWTAPDGLTPVDCFMADLAETFHPAGDAKVGWAWNGESFTAPLTPAMTPAALVAYAADRRFAVETGGVDINGLRIATDRDSQSMVANAYAGMQASGAASVKFKATSGWIELTTDQLRSVALAVFAHVQACFAAEDACDAGINASPPTITTFAEIDAAFASLVSAA